MPPAPTPAPTAAAPAPKPAPIATFTGEVAIAVFSEVITTGEGAKPAGFSIDWDKVEAALRRVEGVGTATLDSASRRIMVGYAGPYKQIDKLRNAVQNVGVSCELLSPAKIVFRPTVVVDEDAKLVNALKGVAGVTDAMRELNDYHVYANLESVDLDDLSKAAAGVGIKGMIASHEVIKEKLSSTGGNSTSLLEELGKTKWVLKASIDSSTNSVKVLAVKGRVTKAVIKSLMSKCGFAESK
jgi:hypothetical protein